MLIVTGLTKRAVQKDGVRVVFLPAGASRTFFHNDIHAIQWGIATRSAGGCRAKTGKTILFSLATTFRISLLNEDAFALGGAGSRIPAKLSISYHPLF